MGLVMSTKSKSESLIALEKLASELIQTWAQNNKDVVWLGAKSREDMRADVLRQLKKAYLLAKDKYAGSKGDVT